MQARDVMQRTVVTVRPGDCLADVARVLLRHGINAAPVVNEAGTVVGVVGIRDILRAPYPSRSSALMIRHTSMEERAQALITTSAQDVMARDLVWVTPESPVEDVTATLANRGRHPILVLEDGRLVGVIGRADVMRVLTDLVAAS